MARVWIVCALVTGALVAGILVLTKDSGGDDGRPQGPRPPPALAEEEVKAYLQVYPQWERILGEGMAAYQEERVARGGEGDAQAVGLAVQARIDTLLERFHLSRETWARLQRRVEYAVEVVRDESVAESRRQDLEAQLALKRDLLRMAVPEDKATVEQDIAQLEAELAWEGRPLHERDRELVKRYADQLERVVPHRGAPPRRQ